MKDKDKTKEQLITELGEMRKRISKLEVTKTGRKQAEEALEKERQDFKLIVDSSPIITFYKDSEGRFVRVNKAFAEVLKRPEEEFLGKTVFDLYSTKIAQGMTDDDQEVFKSGQPKLNIIEQYESASGLRWVQTDKIPIFGKNGIPVGLIGFAQDITEQKQAEEELRQSEERYKAIFELGSDVGEAIIINQDMPGQIAAQPIFNDEWIRITGYNRDELLRMSYFDLIHPEQRDAAINRYHRRLQGEKISGPLELTIVRKDGTEIPIEATATLTSFRGQNATIVYARDITERRQVEEALHLRANLLNNATDSIMAADLEGNILYANDTACRVHGYTKEEMLEMNLKDTVDPSRAELVSERIENITEDGYLSFESEHVRQDGSAFPMEITARTIQLGDKAFILSVQRDITERKQAEEEIRKFKVVIEEANYGVAWFSADEGNTLYVNEAFAEMHGYTCDELIGRNYSVLLTKEQLEDVGRLRQRLLSTANSETLELWKKRKDGSIFPTLTTSILIKDDKGKPLFLAVTAIDISRQKQAEEEIKRFKTVADAADYGITMTTLDNKFIYVNRAYAKMHGYEVDELIGKEYTELYPKEQLPAILRLNDQLRQTGSFINEEVWHSKKDGTAFPTLMNARILNDDNGKPSYKVGTILDITERKQAEEALRNFKTAADTAIYGTAIGTVEHLTYVNRSFAEMHGYSPDELIGQNYSMLYTEEQLPVINKLRERLVAGGSFVGEEVWHKKKNGTSFPALMTGHTIRDDEGNPSLIVGTTIDITERKQMEEKIIRNRDYLERLNDSLSDVIFNIKRPERTIEYVNKTVETMFGYTPDECIGRTTEFLFPNREEYLKVGEVAKRSFRSGMMKLDGEYRYKRRNGEIFLAEATTSFISEDGKMTGNISVIRDVTERKQAEEEITRFKAIASVAPYGVGIADVDGTMTYANQAFDLMHGYAPDEIAGQNFSILYTEEQLETVEKLRKRCLETGSFVGEEAWRKRKDGTTFPSLLSMHLVKDDKGEPLYISSVVIDTTERKQLEEERTKYAKLESVGTLAGGIAHDFNNILTGIMGNISLAMRHVEPKSKAEERLLEAEKASIRARDLTQQLLTFSRSGAPVKNIVSIAGLLKESVGFALRGSNIRCDYDLPDNLWPVEVDEGQINQVITNIIINAQEAMPEGGVINITAGNTVVQGRSTLPLSKGRYVLITVVDQGVGIRKDHLDRIFDPYFTTKQKGSGLGLATSYSIVKAHGGYITVDSTPAVGTAFQIYLPASKESVSVEKEDKAEGVTTGEGRILVMDDEEMVRDLLYAELTEVGYNVELASDGAEAIEQYTKARESEKPFDAVILDLTIPGGMGGKEAIKKLLEIDPDVKAIVSSGYATDPIMSDFKKYGFRAVVTKPYSVAQIEKTLHSLLRKKK